MKIHRIIAIIWRHYFEAIHNLDRLVDMLYWPILDIIVWGFLSIYLFHNNSTSAIVGFLLGAAILWGVFYSLQRDLAAGFLDELWSRNLLNLFSTPLSIWEYIVGLVTVNFIKMLVGFVVASLFAWAFYAFNIFPFSFSLLPFFINLIFFALAMGIFTTALILRYSTKIQTLAWSFAGIFQPISCVFYPLSTLPKWLQIPAWYLPTTHAFEGMRQVLQFGTFSSLHFWWGIILNIIYLMLSLVFFRYIFDIAKDKGILVKLE